MLVKWLIKKPSALCKLKEEKKRAAIQMEDENNSFQKERCLRKEDILSDKNMVR